MRVLLLLAFALLSICLAAVFMWYQVFAFLLHHA
jgi:hypothetical protein